MSDIQNQRDYIDLTESDEKAFRDQLKLGVFKELYRREILTRAQLNHLLGIA